MKSKKYIKVSSYILIMFWVAIFASFIPDFFPNFFGDYACNIRDFHDGQLWSYNHSHWGYRHWLFCSMGICLFIVWIIKVVEVIFSE